MKNVEVEEALRDQGRRHIVVLRRMVAQVKLEVEAYALALGHDLDPGSMQRAQNEFYRRMPAVIQRAYSCAGLPLDRRVYHSWRRRADQHERESRGST